MSQLATRRFLHLLLDDNHFVIRSARSALAQMKPQGEYVVPSSLLSFEFASKTWYRCEDLIQVVCSSKWLESFDSIKTLKSTTLQERHSPMETWPRSTTHEWSDYNALPLRCFPSNSDDLLSLISVPWHPTPPRCINVTASIHTKEALSEYLSVLNDQQLFQLCGALHLINPTVCQCAFFALIRF